MEKLLNYDGLEKFKEMNDETYATNKRVFDIEGYIGYTDSDILGLQVDYQNKTFTRLGAAYGLTKGADFDAFNMFGGRRRCNVADDGTINAYYGDSGYTEDGSNGQVMVYQPKFYYKTVPLKLEKQSSGVGYHVRKANYYICSTPKVGFKIFPAFINANGDEVDYILLGAYEGALYDTSASAYITDDSQVLNTSEDLFCSVANVKPASGLTQLLTRPNVELLAQHRGTNWHGLFTQVAFVDIWLMMIEFGTLNSQTGSGSMGITSVTDQSAYSCTGNTGSTSALGNASGQAVSTTFNINGTTTIETANGKTAYSYRGVENDWGNIWKFVYGMNIWGDGTLDGGVPFICTDFNFAESKRTDNYKSAGFSLPNTNGYISAMGYSEDFDWLLIPSECTGGNSSLPIGDYTYISSNLSGYRIARLGGDWGSGSYAGSLCWVLNDGVGFHARAVGGRLVYIP